MGRVVLVPQLVDCGFEGGESVRLNRTVVHLVRHVGGLVVGSDAREGIVFGSDEIKGARVRRDSESAYDASRFERSAL